MWYSSGSSRFSNSASISRLLGREIMENRQFNLDYLVMIAKTAFRDAWYVPTGHRVIVQIFVYVGLNGVNPEPRERDYMQPMARLLQF